MTTVLVTGGAGFVGSGLALGVKATHPEWHVIAFDNLKRRGSELNLARLAKAGVTFMHGDVRARDDLAGVGHVDLILECSAEPSVLAGYGEAPGYVIETNLGGTVNCLELARRHGAGMIFLSTSRVYPVAALNRLQYREGETRFVLSEHQSQPGASGRGISEGFTLEGARSLYGATKLCSELLIHEYASMYDVRAVINRCGVVAGPWQMGKVDQGIVTLWAARHVFGGRLAYLGYGGSGKQVRDVLHADDLLRLVLDEIERLDDLAGETFNVGGGPENSVSLLELTGLCSELTGHSIEIDSDPSPRPADVPIYITDCAKVTEATGWRPEQSVRRVVEDVIAWLHDHQAVLRLVLSG